MEPGSILDALSDDRCGLYFLAGLDENFDNGQNPVLTVHAANNTLTERQQDFIRSRVREVAPECEVDIRLHTPKSLFAPRSLEGFERLFPHSRIVSDPTGSFEKVQELTKLARAIRQRFGEQVYRIHWKANSSALVIQSKLCEQAEDTDQCLIDLEQHLIEFIAENSSTSLKDRIYSIETCVGLPSGNYAAVDDLSIENTVPVKKSRFGILARLAGLAAIIGLGSVAAAGAKVQDADGVSHMPGIVGIVGLTTLGENSFGVRNQYQAAGGLRLYFGDDGSLVASLSTNSDVMDEIIGTPDLEDEDPELKHAAYAT